MFSASLPPPCVRPIYQTHAMRRALLFAVIVTPLVAVAKPSDSTLAALLHRQLTSDLRARSGIDPSSISKECQPQCTTIIQTLDVRSLYLFILRRNATS